MLYSPFLFNGEARSDHSTMWHTCLRHHSLTRMNCTFTTRSRCCWDSRSYCVI